MKRRIKKQNKGIFVWLIIMLTMFLVLPAEAAKKQPKTPDFPKEWNLYLTGDPAQDYYFLVFKYLPKKAEVVKVVSDETSVAEAEVYKWEDSGEQDIRIQIKKKGTVNLRIRVKVKDKKYILKSKITVRRHKNPFAVLKVGKERLENQFKKAEYIDCVRPKGKQKITIKPVKGWTLKEITYLYKNKTRKLKNKAALNFNKMKEDFSIKIVLNKTGTDLSREFEVYFSEPEIKPDEPEIKPEETESESVA